MSPRSVESVESVEIQEVVAGLPMEESRKQGLTWAYGEMRRITRNLKGDYAPVPDTEDGMADEMTLYRPVQTRGPSTFDFAVFRPLFTELPAEFSLYAEGAAYYHLGEWEEAVALWDQLLSLPPEQRHYRSVWAAQMRGKCLVVLAPDQAVGAFEQVRQLVNDGFSDPFSFQTASLGWQARVEAGQSNYALAIRHYVEQFQRGSAEERASSHLSLDFTCRRMFRAGAAPEEVVRDPVCRQVVSMWVLSGRGYYPTTKSWASALAALPAEDTEELAGALASLFYSQGDMEAAGLWTERARDADLAAQWVHAKLLMRAGKLDESEVVLAGLRKVLEAEPSKMADSVIAHEPVERVVELELATLQLDQDNYAGALDGFIRSGSIADATYIADSIMTAPELATYLKGHTGERLPVQLDREQEWTVMESRPTEEILRYIYARKLAREGAYMEAAAYFPEETEASGMGSEGEKIPIRQEFERLTNALTRGRSSGASSEERAEALMEAAHLTRTFGMEIYGTEHAPDWSIFGGVYVPWGEDRPKANAATAREAERFKTNAPAPNERFHYRWKAAALMWEAAALLPDNDERCAQALWYGGSWIEERDPQGADKFYKALVKRCRKLPIRQEADRLHWFPPEPEAWKE